jgi:hypothetical protein
MQDFSQKGRGDMLTRPKKTPATTPALEFCARDCFKKANRFFKENAALPNVIGRSGVININRFGLLLSINLDFAFQVSQSF